MTTSLSKRLKTRRSKCLSFSKMALIRAVPHSVRPDGYHKPDQFKGMLDLELEDLAEAKSKGSGVQTVGFRNAALGLLDLLSKRGLVEFYIQNGDLDHARLLHARSALLKGLFRRLAVINMRYQERGTTTLVSAPPVHDVLSLFANGFEDLAIDLMTKCWENPAANLAHPRDLKDRRPRKLFWFTSYFAIGRHENIINSGLKEPTDTNTPYSLLLSIWDDPDPSKVRNALAAFSEHNLANSMLPLDKMPADFEETQWWFLPYDIGAINMRRALRGLEWVELSDDPRLDLYDLPRSKQPVVKDDIFWPAYVTLCELAGEVPMSLDGLEVVEVTTDPANFDISLV